MADAEEDSKPFHPVAVTIRKDLRIKGSKVPNSNIIFKKNIPKAHINDPRYDLMDRIELPFPAPGPRINLHLDVPETHPGFLDGKFYKAICTTCKMSNVTVQRKGDRLEIVKLVLCCEAED